MTWMALLIGTTAFAMLAWASGAARRPARDLGARALQVVGGAGLLSLGAAALISGRPVAAAVALVAAALLVVDPRAAARIAAARWARHRAGAGAPFGNAT